MQLEIWGGLPYTTEGGMGADRTDSDTFLSETLFCHAKSFCIALTIYALWGVGTCWGHGRTSDCQSGRDGWVGFDEQLPSPLNRPAQDDEEKPSHPLVIFILESRFMGSDKYTHWAVTRDWDATLLHCGQKRIRRAVVTSSNNNNNTVVTKLQ